MMKDSWKEMELSPGTMVHVINTSLYEESGYWLAWKLSPEGHKVALKKIPSATKYVTYYITRYLLLFTASFAEQKNCMVMLENSMKESASLFMVNKISSP